MEGEKLAAEEAIRTGLYGVGDSEGPFFVLFCFVFFRCFCLSVCLFSLFLSPFCLSFLSFCFFKSLFLGSVDFRVEGWGVGFFFWA